MQRLKIQSLKLRVFVAIDRFKNGVEFGEIVK